MSVWNGSYTAPLWNGGSASTTAKSNQLLYISTVVDQNPYIGITGGNIVQFPSTFQNVNIVDLSAGNVDLSGNLDVSGSITSLLSINAPIGNINDVQSYVTSASYRVETPAILMNDTTVTAYGGNVYANGQLIGGISSNSNVSQWANFVAVNNVNINGCNIINVNNLSSFSINSGSVSVTNGSFSTIAVSSIAATSGSFSTIATSSIAARSGSFSTITVSSIRANVINVSTLSGLIGIFSNFNFSSMSGNSANISTVSANIGSLSTLYVSSLIGNWSNILSNWSYYPALTDINANGKNINNVATLNANNINTGGLTVNGGTTHNGDVRFNGTGNAFSPYWYNFTMDANITTGQSYQIYPPTNNQFFSDYHIAINVLDIESLPNGAFTLAHLDMNSTGLIIPTGNVALSANNYTVVIPYPTPTPDPPFIKFVTGCFRGTAYYGTVGSGQLAYMRMNYDALSLIPNQGALIEINADSYFGVYANPITTSSRIAITGGRNQSFATYQNSVSAGDFGIWPVNTNICEIDMYCPIGYLGGGTTTNRVRGGLLGSRNDMTAEGTLGGLGTEMNIYSTDLMYIYTSGDLYIGYGGEIPAYEPSGSPPNIYQHVHIAQVQDITGRTDNGDIGAQLVNINSIQAYTSNAFIKNFNYLVGYDVNFAYPNEYRLIGISTISTLVLTPVTISTINVFSTITFTSTNSSNISTNYTSSIYPYISTITFSTIAISSLSYQSTTIENNWNPSTINSNLSDWNITRWNYINGISTILQGYQYKGSLVSVNELMASNEVVYSNVEIDYLPYPTTIVPQVPIGEYTPLDLSFAISSLTTSYQYSNVFLIDNYNVLLSSSVAFFSVDSNTCYGSGFSNEIVSSYADQLILIAGWSNQTGFFDVYNGGDIPIGFQSEYYNELPLNAIPAYTNSRAIFQGQSGDPPIIITDITTDNLQPVYISTIYQNNTYFTQSGSNTLFEIDLSGIDVNGNPISSIGTLVVNAIVDLDDNNIQNVNQIYVDTLAPNTTDTLYISGNLNMYDNNIENVNQINVDFIQPAYSDEVQFYSTVDLGNNLLSGVSQINVDTVATNLSGIVTYNNTVNINGNDIQGVNSLNVDAIGTNLSGVVSYNNNIDMSDNNITKVNQISVDFITPNVNSQIDFQGNILSNINTLYISSFSCTIPNPDVVAPAYVQFSYVSWPDITNETPPYYFSYTTDFETYTPVAADWSVFQANQTVNLDDNPITNISYIELANGSQIQEITYMGGNWLLLNNNTVIGGDIEIVNGSANPTLTFNNGKRAFIDFGDNFRISCNVDLMYNDLSNVNTITVDYINGNSNGYVTIEDLSSTNINVSTINSIPFQIIQNGITTAGSTVTIPIAYSLPGSYGIQLTYTGVTITSNLTPLASVINNVSSFTVWGKTGVEVFWTTMGV